VRELRFEGPDGCGLTLYHLINNYSNTQFRRQAEVSRFFCRPAMLGLHMTETEGETKTRS
jgi:hypothetical protein